MNKEIKRARKTDNQLHEQELVRNGTTGSKILLCKQTSRLHLDARALPAVIGLLLSLAAVVTLWPLNRPETLRPSDFSLVAQT